MNNFGLEFCLPLSLACFAAVTFGAGPVRAQGGDSAAQSVTIINTGGPIIPGYRITVGPEGQLSSTLQPRNGAKAIVRTDQMTSLNRHRFFRDLTKAGPLNALPVGTGQGMTGSRRGRRNRAMPQNMAGSLSGPQVYVLYRGRQTPNLRAAGSSAGKAIYQDVKQIMNVLRMPIPDYP